MGDTASEGNPGPVMLIAVDRGVAAQLSALLETARVGVTVCQYGPDTLRSVAAQEPPLVVADLSRLPGEGEMLCHQLSRLFPAPMLLAIVSSGAEAAAAALNRGAVACLRQPVEVRHLAAQVVALLRLTKREKRDTDAVMEVGGLTIDRGRCQVLAKGRPLALTPTEFRIVSCLARTPGRVISPSEVMRECIGLSLSDHEAMDLLKVHIYRLRRKLREAGAAPGTLRNARGFGYLLERRVTGKAVSASAASLRRSA